MKKRSMAAACLLLVCILSSCAQTQEKPPSVTRTSFMLDTVVTITLYDWTDEETLTGVMVEIGRLEQLLSVEKEGSDLDRLTQAAGSHWVDISPECQEILLMAKEYWTISQGHFDVTVGPLIDLWDIGNGGHYPSEDELAQVLPLIGSDRLLLEDGRAYLEDPGMKANLGAIAKGYIGDKVKEYLLEAGVEHAIIDLGRDIQTIGGRPDGTDFHIGVASPFVGEEDEIVRELLITDLTVVTAGVSERYFEYEEVRYHHILDPFTGFPADTGLASVTILARNSAEADALSTSCMLLGPEDGMALVESLDGMEALFVLADGTQMESSGLSAYIV